MSLTTTETSICNSALIKIGADRINSMTETNRRAQLCNEQYSKVRDEVLRSHPWNFAITRAEFSQLTTTPSFGYNYEYSIPSDCLRILSLHAILQHRGHSTFCLLCSLIFSLWSSLYCLDLSIHSSL